MITTLILQNCCYIFLQYHSSLEYWDALHNVFHNFQWVCLSNARLSLLWYLGITFEISFPLSNLGAKGISLSGVCQNSLILKKITKRLCQRFDTTSCSFVRLLVVEHIQILYLFEQTRKGIRMTRIRLKRERERRLMRPVLPGLTRCMRQGLCYKYQAIGIAWSNNLY